MVALGAIANLKNILARVMISLRIAIEMVEAAYELQCYPEVVYTENPSVEKGCSRVLIEGC